MSLPINNVPIYELILKSSDKKIKYKPFQVKEEKIMLMAAQSKDLSEIKDAIKQIITNCVVEPKDFKVEETPIFDIEWILINLRIKSVGSKIENDYICSNEIDGIACNEPFKVSIGIDDIKVDGNSKPDEKIMLSPTMGVIMRPPRFKIMQDVKPEVTDNEYDTTILEEAIVSVFDMTQKYNFADQSKEEVKEWFDSLTKDQFEKIKAYLNQLPSFTVNKEHKCTKCGFIHKIKVDDLASFF